MPLGLRDGYARTSRGQFGRPLRPSTRCSRFVSHPSLRSGQTLDLRDATPAHVGSPPIHFIHSPSAGLRSISVLLALRGAYVTLMFVSCPKGTHEFVPSAAHRAPAAVTLHCVSGKPWVFAMLRPHMSVYHLRATRTTSSPFTR